MSTSKSQWGKRREEEFVDSEDDITVDKNLDNIVVVDNIPQAQAAKMNQLKRVLHEKIFAKFGVIDSEIPVDEEGAAKGFAFIEVKNSKMAAKAVAELDGTALDARHVLKVTPFAELDKLLDVPEEYVPYEPKPYKERDNLSTWLLDRNARDQFAVRFWETTEIHLHDPVQKSIVVEKREKWTEDHIEWSPHGSYLVTFHDRGVVLWGGERLAQQASFKHAGVKLVDFSPKENYLVTWSPSTEDNVVVWNARIGKALRAFTQPADEVAKSGWPVFKWSSDERYFSKLGENCINIYETSKMTLLGKQPVEIENIKDFAWSPSDNFAAYWIPEIGDMPATVAIIEIPSMRIIAQKIVYNASNINLHWHPSGDLLAAKVDRVSKSKKPLSTYFEIFNLREKGCPVEQVEVKDTIVAFAWEPQGTKFAIIHASAAGPSSKADVSFYSVNQDHTVKHVKTLEQKQANNLFWSPQGRYIVLAGLKSMNGVLEFWDTQDMELLGSGDHFMATHVEWDPSGRYVATHVSHYLHTLENGFIIWSFIGIPLHRFSKDKFWQFLWRPRPPTLLSKEQEQQVEKQIQTKAKWRAMEQEWNATFRAAEDKEAKERRKLMEAFKLGLQQRKKDYQAEKAARKALRGGIDSDDDADYEVVEQVVEQVTILKKEPVD